MGDKHGFTLHKIVNSIDFSDNSEGYIVGDSGTILKTLNIGETWNLERFKNANNLVYVRYFNGGICYINDAKGFLYSKIDYIDTLDIDTLANQVFKYKI